ncbi:hypothetical protein E1283_16135 [Streptomyces hainanensis]|uniref:Uncharacterized protein n=1 Tax=Streptomyces hainanensis TaxID=402648 RepID=A0A4R4TAX1_9ACTN|nr:hypothetical protein E1283_16135 [Streptomyces hainanensis]
MNAVLGLVGVVPCFFLWYFLSDYPLHDLGLTAREPTENDGIGVVAFLLLLVGGWFLAVWLLSNVPVRKGTPARSLPTRRYWATSSAVSCAPTLVVVLWAAVNRL